MSYKIIYSARKTLALEIDSSGALLVRSPYAVSSRFIADFIAKKQSWIIKKQAQLSYRQSQHSYNNGCLLLYLGRYYPMLFSKNEQVNFNNGLFFMPKENSRLALLNFYKTAFKAIVLPRLYHYAKAHQLGFNQLYLKRQKTRWGSCSTQNNINLNYLLIQAPLAVIDAVVIHELAHIRYKNHSKDFYQFLKKIMPDYGLYHRWLKEFGYLLRF